jgi:c-di-GMP-binding flagellar brake protein YcgR
MNKDQQFKEQRKKPRIITSNMVSYQVYNADGKKVENGKGWTVNLSQTGTLLGTRKALAGYYIILMTMDISGKKIQIKGKVTRTSNLADDASGMYFTGIEFIGPRDEQREVIVAFVKAYQRNKHLND